MSVAKDPKLDMAKKLYDEAITTLRNRQKIKVQGVTSGRFQSVTPNISEAPREAVTLFGAIQANKNLVQRNDALEAQKIELVELLARMGCPSRVGKDGLCHDAGVVPGEGDCIHCWKIATDNVWRD